MQFTVVTIFPELFAGFVTTSLVGRAIDAGRIAIGVHDLRDYAAGPHRVVDDEPYGGGEGMVMLAEPWLQAVAALEGADGSSGREPAWRVLLSPQGRPLDDERVRTLAQRPHLLLLCGRYEGIDERVRTRVVDEEISLGDFVLSGGEVAAMAVIEAVSRQVPGVVGDPRSVVNESFRSGLLDYPHYTRPREVAGEAVPEVLLSGDHARIEAWRRREALRRTLERRPDLIAAALEAGRLDETDRRLVAELRDSVESS